MEELTIDLEDLSIHRLNIVPHEADSALEFQLHATIEDLDTEMLELVANNEFVPTKVVGEIGPIADE